MSHPHPPLRVGIVGAGYIAGVHSAAYRVVRGTFPDEVPRVRLVRAVDSDGQRLERFAAAWGWDQTAAEIRAITRADDIDVVDVCAPNHLHARVAIDALEHGKHVICEKPLAAELEHAGAMAEAAAAASGLAQVCFYYRTWPLVQHARQLIDQGAIGRVTHFSGRMLQSYAADPGLALGWRASAKQGGAGALDDLGSHILDIARFLGGDLRVLDARTDSTVKRAGPALIDEASARFEFASGAGGRIDASWAAPGHSCDLGFEIRGEDGAIAFSWERANELQLQPARRSEFERVLLGPDTPGAGAFLGVPGQQMGYRDAFTLGVGRFLTAVATGAASAEPTFDDGFRVAELVAAVRAAAAMSPR